MRSICIFSIKFFAIMGCRGVWVFLGCWSWQVGQFFAKFLDVLGCYSTVVAKNLHEKKIITYLWWTWKGLLTFILLKDMVTVDLEVMTLTGVHVYKKGKNNLNKWLLPWSKKICLLQIFGKGERNPKTGDIRIFKYITKSGHRAKL